MANTRGLESGDIRYVADNLREADRRELTALRGAPVDAMPELCNAVLRSSKVWVLADVHPIAVFGVAPVAEGVGSPWLLGTEELFRYPRLLVCLTPEYVSQMLADYPVLVNYVDARNYRSIRWLEHMGFTLEDPIPQGPHGVPFRLFHMRVATACASPQVQVPARRH